MIGTAGTETMMRRIISDYSGRGALQRLCRGRFLRAEILEPRLLLAVSQGITDPELSELAAVYAGFDFSDIEARNVYVVDSADLTAATLRDAVAAAQKAAGADMILIRTTGASHTVTFSDANDTIVICDASPLLLAAVGDEGLIVDAAGHTRSIFISSGTSTMLGNLTLIGGSADNGGAIFNEGSLTLVGSTISSNTASLEGGGIYSISELTMINSVVSGNKASGNGGGVLLTGSFAADASIVHHVFVNCTITGNRAGLDESGKGGGIYFKGQDADFNIYSDLALNNSIIVDNRSAATTIDENIYNSVFYNEFTFDGVTSSYEFPVAALIDGDNNLTTFIYWVSYYDPDNLSQTGTNSLYHDSVPLFVRSYDFDLSKEGDYTLEESAISQAIDHGDNAKAVFKNVTAVSLDRSGKKRIQNNNVDLGAYEFAYYTDLAANNGGILSNEYVLQNSTIQISELSLVNNGGGASEAATIRFYASEDEYITTSDIFLGESEIFSIAGYASRTFNSGTFLTSPLSAGCSYYLGWIVDLPSDMVRSNNSGRCLTQLHLFAESSPFDIIELEKSFYTVQEGCSFFLSTAELPEPGITYWWDCGDGVFTEGNASDWVDVNRLGLSCGDYVIQLKAVLLNTKTVVAVGSAALRVTWNGPTISAKKTSIAEGQILKITLDSFFPGGRDVAQWTINWGDGQIQMFDSVSSFLKTAHCYAKTDETQTYNVILTLVDTNGSGSDVSYAITTHTVKDSQAMQALASDLEEGILSDDIAQQAVIGPTVMDKQREELRKDADKYYPQVLPTDYAIEIQPYQIEYSSSLDDTLLFPIANITVQSEFFAPGITISIAGFESNSWLRDLNKRLEEKINDEFIRREYQFASDAVGDYTFALPFAFPSMTNSDEVESAFETDSEQWLYLLDDY